ncbi:uncharacterized protein LOC117788065 [Drosophila innubila]|uniref:uncharacterized protein LOC117788065 n=1 Tax=Drosophila innubila TaxID=198719 RepID=UPI00148B9318|nr:uncharacterized protein LOC117788065 [Drosophila innubila]
MCFLGAKILMINTLISAVFLAISNIVEIGVAIKDLARVQGSARYLLIASIWLNACTVCVILLGIYGTLRSNLAIITVYLTTLVAYFLGKFFLSITVEHLDKQQFDLILTPFYTINAVFCVICIGFLGSYYCALKADEEDEVQ